MAKKEDAPKEAPKKHKSLWREYGEAILIAFLLALLIRTFVIQAFKIPSGSMKNTLLIGDHILVSKFTYGIHIPNQIPWTNIIFFDDIRLFAKTPERGDIIVFKFPQDESRDFIKRVIGLPGDVLELRRQKVFINGQPFDDSAYAIHTQPVGTGLVPHWDEFGPVRVPEGHVFVMGDNRENSSDSRVWGFLDMDKIKGKAQMIYFSRDGEEPLYKLSRSIRWERIFNGLN